MREPQIEQTNKQTTKTYVNSGKQDFNSIMVDAISIHAIHFRESKFLFGSRCCRGTSSPRASDAVIHVFS